MIWVPSLRRSPSQASFDPGLLTSWMPESDRLSRRWRRILAGPQSYTSNDIGGCCCGGYSCGACSIPQQDLVISWDNLISGPGSATLVYSGSPTTWNSGCVDQLIYELLCTSNAVEFRVYYFLSGSCPTGQSQYCSTIGTAPYALTQTGLTCGSSFLLTCTVSSSSCPTLASYGYTDFTVSI
jgi:hypothetical protein